MTRREHPPGTEIVPWLMPIGRPDGLRDGPNEQNARRLRQRQRLLPKNHAEPRTTAGANGGARAKTMRKRKHGGLSAAQLARGRRSNAARMRRGKPAAQSDGGSGKKGRLQLPPPRRPMKKRAALRSGSGVGPSKWILRKMRRNVDEGGRPAALPRSLGNGRHAGAAAVR